MLSRLCDVRFIWFMPLRSLSVLMCTVYSAVHFVILGRCFMSGTQLERKQKKSSFRISHRYIFGQMDIYNIMLLKQMFPYSALIIYTSRVPTRWAILFQACNTLFRNIPLFERCIGNRALPRTLPKIKITQVMYMKQKHAYCLCAYIIQCGSLARIIPIVTTLPPKGKYAKMGKKNFFPKT